MLVCCRKYGLQWHPGVVFFVLRFAIHCSRIIIISSVLLIGVTLWFRPAIRKAEAGGVAAVFTIGVVVAYFLPKLSAHL